MGFGRVNAVMPAPPGSSSTGCRSWPKRVVDWVWAYTHTEHTGFYSLEKLHCFQLSTHHSVAHQLGSLLLATLPTVVLVAAITFIPLQDPTLPWTQNPGFYVRLITRAWMMAIGTNIQMQEFIPQLRQPWQRVVLLALAQISTAIVTLILIAQAFDIFPVPLSNVTPLIPGLLGAIVVRYLFVQKIIDREPELKPIHDRAERLMAFTFGVIILYCAYSFAFIRADSLTQIVLSAALFAIKQSVKHSMWRLSHLRDHHDLSAESVSCGVHLFHALFTTTCLQSARSAGTFVVVIVLNVVQDVLTFRFLRRISIQVDALVKNSVSDDTQMSVSSSPWHAEWTARLLSCKTMSNALCRSDLPPIMLLQSAYFRYKSVEAPVALDVGGARRRKSSDSTHREATATQAIANLLHCRELVLLRLYVDIFVPLFYLVYCIGMRYLPNTHWQYFDNLAGLNKRTLAQLAVSILPLVAIKLLVLYQLCLLFRTSGQPSGLHQLSFVVKAQRWSMQVWFVMHFLYVIDFPLAHMGNDLSFRFEWLGKKH